MTMTTARGKPDNPNVAIVGAGPAGLACAIKLADIGIACTVFERAVLPARRVGETFPGAIREVMTRLGVWSEFESASHLRSTAILSAWGNAEPHERNLMFDIHGEGWHVDRPRFDAMLEAHAERRDVVIRRGHQVLSCDAIDNRWQITTRNCGADSTTESSRASYVVDATGRNAAIARRFGATRVTADRLVGTVAEYKSISTAPTLLIETDPGGWFYSAPVPGNRLVVVRLTDVDICGDHQLRNPEGWNRAIQAAPHTHQRLSGGCLVRPVSMAPAATSRLDRFAGCRWLAVGDAATAHDPLSGDGVLRALANGERAASAIASDLSGDRAEVDEYAADLMTAFDAATEMRKTFYRRETRWPETRFWSRRRLDPYGL